MSVLAESQGGKRIQAQSHPLKSFTVPAPPPISAPGTPQPKHIGKFSLKRICFESQQFVSFFMEIVNKFHIIYSTFRFLWF